MTLLRNPSLKCTKENEVIYRIHHRLQRNRLTKKSSSLANATICLSMPCNQLYHAFYTIFWRNKVHLNCEWKTRKWIIHPSWLHLKLGSTEIKLEKIQASAVSIPCLPNTHCTTNWATKPRSQRELSMGGISSNPVESWILFGLFFCNSLNCSPLARVISLLTCYKEVIKLLTFKSLRPVK